MALIDEINPKTNGDVGNYFPRINCRSPGKLPDSVARFFYHVFCEHDFYTNILTGISLYVEIDRLYIPAGFDSAEEF